jgi:hypothetical protein
MHQTPSFQTIYFSAWHGIGDMLCEAGQENGTEMRSKFVTLPVFIKLSALFVGAPLVVLGVWLLFSDASEMMRSHTMTSAPLAGLAFGPMCVFVGLSFLWPLRINGYR